MAIEFKLPDVGEGLHEAELLKWLVDEGDYVREDQPLMEVQTDKAAVEITSPVNAQVSQLMGAPGDILHVGNVVVVFGDGKAGTVPGEKEAEAAVAVAAPAGTEPRAAAGVAVLAATEAAPATVPGGRALAAPATRKLARELGVDINRVAGSGPAGRVSAEDVRLAVGGTPTAIPTPATAAPVFTPAGDVIPAAPTQAQAAARAPVVPGVAEERIPLRGIRKVIAERMVKSKHTAPHVTTVDEVDMTELSAFRESAKAMAAAKGVKLSFMPFIFKALTVALKEYPYFNAAIDDERQEIVLKRQYHMGMALDTEAGLLVPVIRDVDRKSVFAIAREMQDLIERGRAGKLQPDELRGSTFTVSNQGSIGGLFFTPVINHPEVAILGLGQTLDRPVARDGQVVIRAMAYLALSFDHRLVDGAVATRFLNRVKELLSNPTLLMMEAM
ncbi:MAG TPA: dihydrolipoamide acetyltransferase family protein [Symbiobacteriaceae bacterium]|jgi:pyruvate dehydrogenase E2 component (dihydrolipoamide acetyltransferase)